jgi:hypothetical protein
MAGISEVFQRTSWTARNEHADEIEKPENRTYAPFLTDEIAMARLQSACWTSLCLLALPAGLCADERESLRPVDPVSLIDELAQVQPTTPTGPGPRPTTQSTPLTLTTPDSSPTRPPRLARNTVPEYAGDFFVGRFGSIPVFDFFAEHRIESGVLHLPGGSRSLKISDNESPCPQDRVYVAFNYFDDYSRALTRRLGDDERFFEYRETLGLEKTFCCGNASLGLRLPLSTIHTDSNDPPANQITGDSTRGLAGTESDVGDLAVILKYALWNECEIGRVFSVGMLITTPTGQQGNNPFHQVVLQPYLGYIYRCDDWFIHGFSAVDVPTDRHDSTIMFNDVGVGYFIYQCPDECQCITAVVPMFEVHVNTPLNHHGALGTLDPAGTSTTVDLTIATSVELHGCARFMAGVAIPVSGPRPFEFEILTALNLRF